MWPPEKATIDFEVGIPPDPMNTPEVINTIDADAPTSQVLPLPDTQEFANFEVQWSGTDASSGIGGFTIYVSENDGPYLSWLTNVTSTSAALTGLPDHTYKFFSRARDKVGSFEDLLLAADATTQAGQKQGVVAYLPIILKNN